ncbi:ABC transporter substrate-binding protein [Pseudonocardia sp. EC080619-01]|uniref:ABC transporter substrate-binding protein n=1 Tax=Pseudonocardia sp. EC080619-01 TaxID=1096856 RepID=UPI001D0583B3|nr:iron-siderophore ABC transporter substrate-binding protein [Pseudonocardia sp. EC080619-01]
MVVAAGCSAPADEASTAQGRTVAHARGEATVPEKPERVVTLEPAATDTTVGLGIPAAGATVFSEAVGVPRYLGEGGSAITSVGTVDAPNLETIAALDPDLIIGTETRHSQFYDQLSAIAPTVYLANHLDPWQDNVRTVGRALGREQETEALMQRYQDRCAEIDAKHRTAGRTAQMIRPRDAILTLYGPTSFAGTTLECTGLTIPPREWVGGIQTDLSPELAVEAGADEVFVTVPDPASADPLPTTLTSVQDRAFPRLHTVDQAVWITGVGPVGGMAVLDDIDRALGGAG